MLFYNENARHVDDAHHLVERGKRGCLTFRLAGRRGARVQFASVGGAFRRISRSESEYNLHWRECSINRGLVLRCTLYKDDPGHAFNLEATWVVCRCLGHDVLSLGDARLAFYCLSFSFWYVDLNVHI